MMTKDDIQKARRRILREAFAATLERVGVGGPERSKLDRLAPRLGELTQDDVRAERLPYEWERVVLDADREARGSQE